MSRGRQLKPLLQHSPMLMVLTLRRAGWRRAVPGGSSSVSVDPDDSPSPDNCRAAAPAWVVGSPAMVAPTPVAGFRSPPIPAAVS